MSTVDGVSGEVHTSRWLYPDSEDTAVCNVCSAPRALRGRNSRLQDRQLVRHLQYQAADQRPVPRRASGLLASGKWLERAPVRPDPSLMSRKIACDCEQGSLTLRFMSPMDRAPFY